MDAHPVSYEQWGVDFFLQAINEALERETRDHEQTFVGDLTTGEPSPREVG
ncbi:MAG: hypothetical protein ABIR34_01205 [Marmoricola sp.]